MSAFGVFIIIFFSLIFLGSIVIMISAFYNFNKTNYLEAYKEESNNEIKKLNLHIKSQEENKKELEKKIKEIEKEIESYGIWDL